MTKKRLPMKLHNIHDDVINYLRKETDSSQYMTATYYQNTRRLYNNPQTHFFLLDND